MGIFRKISFYLAIVGLVAAGVMVWRLRANEPVCPPPVAPPAKPAGRAIAASGLVEARRENTSIGVPAAGLVTEVCVKVWDCVKAGQPLLKLDDRDLRASLLTEEANITVAEATLRRIQDQYQRTRKLALCQPPIVSEDEVETRSNDVAVAEAQLQAARAGVAQTQSLLERLIVKAPIDGTILQVNVRAGEYASPTATSAPVVLGSIDEVQVRADVDEQLAPRVRAGQKAIAYLKGDAGHPIPLQFVRIEPYVIPKVSLTGSTTERVDTRVLEVIYAFKNNSDRPVYVGQQMDVFIDE
jgi:RND family efflux transporter MFP subunit